MHRYLIGALLLCQGCATIFSGTSDNITFTTRPDGATVLINGIPKGITPTTVQVNRPGVSNNVVTIKKDGFEDITFVMDKSFNGVSIINLGNILGWGIDAMTGALMKNSSPSYEVALEKKRNQVSQSLDVKKVQFVEELKKDTNGNSIIDHQSKDSLAIVNRERNVALIFKQ